MILCSKHDVSLWILKLSPGVELEPPVDHEVVKLSAEVGKAQSRSGDDASTSSLTNFPDIYNNADGYGFVAFTYLYFYAYIYIFLPIFLIQPK